MICYNKILKETLPAEMVFSQNDLVWLHAYLVNNNGKFEDKFYIVTFK